MSAPIPVDIESGEQWQVRFEGLSGNEVTKTGSKGQMVYVAKARREFGAVLEKRTITVSAWEAVDPDNPDPVVEGAAPLSECPRSKFPDGTLCGDYGFHGLGCPDRGSDEADG